jgi:hypothetical protein
MASALVVVDYNRELFIVELKLWHGEEAHEAAYKQLAGYLRSKGAQRGYLVTLDLRKSASREPLYETVFNHKISEEDIRHAIRTKIRDWPMPDFPNSSRL